MTRRGDMIAGKYEVLTLLGEGAMASVWLVNDKALNKEWAVKEIRKVAHDEHNEIVLQTLITESNLMKEFDHPLLPRVVDVVEDEEATYVVMDRVQGRSLDKVMEESGKPFLSEDVVEWGKSLCDVLEYLHGMNPPVIYRDMKPDNIMLRDDNTVRLIDFGVAKKYKDYKASDTVLGGTPGYAAPEQLGGNQFSTVQSDVYALGATLHHLVTGRAPWEDTHKRPIRQIDASLPEGLEYIIEKATQEDPEKRYQNCAEMRSDLERYKKLTSEFRAEQENKLKRFNLYRGIAIGCVLLGIACFALGFFFKGRAYDALISEAEAADTTERAGEQSAAEGYYAAAIEIDPGNLDAYEKLVEGYRSNMTVDSDGNERGDNNFTKTEEARWAQLFNVNRESIEGSDRFAKLCYDVGVLYLVYYENEATVADSSGPSRSYAVSGSITAAQWFGRAIDSYDNRNGDCTLSASEYSAARVYKIIGEFNESLSQATFEGNEGSVYEGYWDALREAVDLLANGDDEAASTIVRLRLYQIAYEALGSPTYLDGFRRTGVSADEAVKLYHDVMDLFAYDEQTPDAAGVNADVMEESKQLYNAAKANARTAELYEGIHLSRQQVADNIRNIYGDYSLLTGKNYSSESASQQASPGAAQGEGESR